MEFLKTGTFGGLFQVTFVIAATFQLACGLLGAAAAVLAPGSFKLNGVAANSPGQALTSLTVMLVVMLLLNLAISAGGSGLWLLARRVFFKPQPVGKIFS